MGESVSGTSKLNHEHYKIGLCGTKEKITHKVHNVWASSGPVLANFPHCLFVALEAAFLRPSSFRKSAGFPSFK